MRSLDLGSKVTVLTNGPLTTLAKIIQSEKASSMIQVCFSYLIMFFLFFGRFLKFKVLPLNSCCLVLEVDLG